MEWTSLTNMIDPKLLMVVAVCWVLGFIFKQTPYVPNWTIVFLVTAFSVGFTVWMVGVTPESFLQGILCGAVAVYGNQIVKQVKERAGE